MLSIAALAERDGVSKQAVSKNVKGLVAKHGLTVERDARDRIMAVNAAEYDHLRGRYGDPSKAQAQSRTEMASAVASSESYDEALRQRTWTEAERSRLRLEEEKGLLVKVDEVKAAADAAAEEIARVVGRLPNLADDLAATVGRDGAHGARVLLRNKSTEMRDQIAKALEALAGRRMAGAEPADAP